MNEKKTKRLKKIGNFKILSTHWRIIPDVHSMIDELFGFFFCELTFLGKHDEKKKEKNQ